MKITSIGETHTPFPGATALARRAPTTAWLLVAVAIATPLAAQSGTSSSFEIVLPAPGTYFSVRNASAAPEITLDDRLVRIVGKVAVLFGASVHSDSGVAIHRQYQETLEAEEGEETIAFDVGRSVPRRSVWVAVHPESGEIAVAKGRGRRLREVEAPTDGIRTGPRGFLNRLFHSRGLVSILLVRPGLGAWSGIFGDGAGTDKDGQQDGKTLASLEDMEPLGRSPTTPEQLKPGDVLAMIDLFNLEFYAVGLTR